MKYGSEGRRLQDRPDALQTSIPESQGHDSEGFCSLASLASLKDFDTATRQGSSFRPTEQKQKELPQQPLGLVSWTFWATRGTTRKSRQQTAPKKQAGKARRAVARQGSPVTVDEEREKAEKRREKKLQGKKEKSGD